MSKISEEELAILSDDATTMFEGEAWLTDPDALTRLIAAYREQRETYQSVAATQQRQLEELRAKVVQQHKDLQRQLTEAREEIARLKAVRKFRYDQPYPQQVVPDLERETDLERQLAEARVEVERLKQSVSHTAVDAWIRDEAADSP